MRRGLQYLAILLLFLSLILIRAFQNKLFYDPFIDYFQDDYLLKVIPDVKINKLVGSLFFRYALNTCISLGIIFLVFRNKNYLKFSSIFYSISFVALIIVYVILIRTDFKSGYLFPFYIRRFLVHPLFLLVLLAAFYYQSFNTSKEI